MEKVRRIVDFSFCIMLVGLVSYLGIIALPVSTALAISFFIISAAALVIAVLEYIINA